MATETSFLYVHAPFCARRCNYCDFAVHVSRTGDVQAWQSAIAGELAAVENEGLFRLSNELDTLYVGGGTPSLLGAEAMKRLAEVVGPHRLEADGLEWTSEANPESLTLELAKAWRAAGVNRLSLGTQTFHEPTLKWMGRLHGSEGAVQSVKTAKAAGLSNLSIDLIFGLPQRLDRDWGSDLDQALAMDVPHVSLYGLTVESGTPLGRAVAEGRETPIDEERYRDEYLLAAEVLTAAGYEHYEVSNFARPGRRSLHNTAYWDGSAYLGLGNGAHSYAHPVRKWNERDWPIYVVKAVAGTSPEADRERIGEAEQRLETYWLGLRTDAGLSVDGLAPAQQALVASWAARGWTKRVEPTVALNAEGWLLLDRLAVELDEAATG